LTSGLNFISRIKYLKQPLRITQVILVIRFPFLWRSAFKFAQIQESLDLRSPLPVKSVVEMGGRHYWLKRSFDALGIAWHGRHGESLL